MSEHTRLVMVTQLQILESRMANIEARIATPSAADESEQRVTDDTTELFFQISEFLRSLVEENVSLWDPEDKLQMAQRVTNLSDRAGQLLADLRGPRSLN